MQDVVQELFRLHQRCAQLADNLEAKYGLPSHQVPISGLNMGHQPIVLCLELCDYYRERWKNFDLGLGVPREKLIAENGERVIAATKAMFIMVLSAIEFAAKDAARMHQSIIPMDWTRRQYLAGIVGKAHALGMIDAATKKLWDGTITIRNTLVHNNGIADETTTIEFPGGPKVELKINQMMQGNLLQFIKITGWAIGAYAEWCNVILSRATSSP